MQDLFSPVDHNMFSTNGNKSLFLCFYAMFHARLYKAVLGLSGVCSKRGFCRADSHALVPVSILGRESL